LAVNYFIAHQLEKNQKFYESDSNDNIPVVMWTIELLYNYLNFLAIVNIIGVNRP